MSVRLDRIGEIIRAVVATQVGNLSDPRLSLVSITGVHLSADLSYATIYFSALDDDARADAADALEAAHRRIQGAVANALQTRRTPRLSFAVDPGIVQGERIDALLRQLSDQDGSDAPG